MDRRESKKRKKERDRRRTVEYNEWLVFFCGNDTIIRAGLEGGEEEREEGRGSARKGETIPMPRYDPRKQRGRQRTYTRKWKVRTARSNGG